MLAKRLETLSIAHQTVVSKNKPKHPPDIDQCWYYENKQSGKTVLKSNRRLGEEGRGRR
jgi:hypothetical protein